MLDRGTARVGSSLSGRFHRSDCAPPLPLQRRGTHVRLRRGVAQRTSVGAMDPPAIGVQHVPAPRVSIVRR